MTFAEYKAALLKAVAKDPKVTVRHDDLCSTFDGLTCDCNPIVAGMRLREPKEANAE